MPILTSREIVWRGPLPSPRPLGSYHPRNSALNALLFDGVPASGVTGTMAVTESGSDTFASAGVVIVKGALAVTESGSDTFASSGDVFVQGAMAASETGADVAAMSGDVIVQGALAVTEQGEDVASMTGQVIVSGTMAVTESGSDTFTATVPTTAKKKGGMWLPPRERSRKRPPVEIVVDLRDRVDVPAEPTPAPVVAPPTAPEPVYVPKFLVPPVNVSAVLDVASEAYRDAVRAYVQGALEQEAFRDAQARVVAEEIARREAELIFKAAMLRARDEDEAAALIMIMSAVEEQ